MSKRVWYAAFGSNLSFERFLVYLNGGRAKGSTGSVPGARDSTPPKQSTTMFTSRALKFGGKSQRWSGGGVAFLESTGRDSRTALRLYDITAQQFEDVFQQENGLDEPLDVDMESVIAQGLCDLTNRWYGRVLLLGNRDEMPIVTITSPRPPGVNAPHPTYLQTIIHGLRSVVDGDGFDLHTDDQIREHLTPALNPDAFSDDDWDVALAQ